MDASEKIIILVPTDDRTPFPRVSVHSQIIIPTELSGLNHVSYVNQCVVKL
jgi:hypothetical protein